MSAGNFWPLIARFQAREARAWTYPHQTVGWGMVSFGKLGAWFLLLIVSYTLVAWVNKPEQA